MITTQMVQCCPLTMYTLKINLRFFVPAILAMSSYCLCGGVFLYHTRLRLGPPR